MFAVPTPNAGVNGITAAPDQTIWFTEKSAHKIGVLTSLGRFTEYAARSGDTPVDITGCLSGISSSIYGLVVTADNGSSGAVLSIDRVDKGSFTSERDDSLTTNDPASTVNGTTCLPSTSHATRQPGAGVKEELPKFSVGEIVDIGDHDVEVGSEGVDF
jgi:hypothetical protein